MDTKRKEQRKSTFKKTQTKDESTTKRVNNALEIRKVKREENLLKKRNVSDNNNSSNNNSISSGTTQFNNLNVKIEDIPIYKKNLEHPSTVLEGVVAFRKLLSIERNPPINQVIQSGVVPILTALINEEASRDLLFETLWALTNIASGTSEQTAVLIQYGCVQKFILLLLSNDEEIREQSVWALGNIAGDSPQCRDFVLQCKVMQPLLTVLKIPTNKITMLRNATWCLSNLARGKPQPNFNLVSPSLPILGELIKHPDSEVMTDACWAFSYLSDGPDSNITACLQTGVAPKIVQLLGHSSYSVQTPALRTIGNIVTGSDEQTQIVLDLNVLPSLAKLLQSARKTIKKEAAWALSNICAGNYKQTQLVIAANIFPAVIKLALEGDFDVRKECTWVLSNATTWKNVDQIRYLVAAGILKPLIELLTAKDGKLVAICLEALENILIAGDEAVQTRQVNENPYTGAIEDLGGVTIIEDLQDHENNEVYDKAVQILEKYYEAEEEDDNLAPGVNNNSNTFSFGINNDQNNLMNMQQFMNLPEDQQRQYLQSQGIQANPQAFISNQQNTMQNPNNQQFKF